MEIPDDVLSMLSCVECGAVLGRGPVFQAHDGAALCSRCVRPDRPTSRNQIYEAVARLLRFPCKNREFGCTDTVPFTLDTEDVLHELGCSQRQYLCPVVPRGQCDWLGSRQLMLNHCETQHPDTVVRNGVQLTHDISKSSQNTYLLYAFHVLFLLHTKVCVPAGKIFHSIRVLSDANNAAKFSFTVDVKRGKFSVSKSYPVAPPGCLAMQEDTSLAMSINSLLEILDGFKGTEFTVTVYDTTGCVKCSAELKQYYYPDVDGWLCDKCAPAKRSCKFKECTYMDMHIKCEKHEMYFCPHSSLCYFCNDIGTKIKIPLVEHYTDMHGDITHASGSTWRNSYREFGKIYIISSDFGLLRCRTWPKNNSFELVVTSPFVSEQLNEFCCEIKLTHPITKYSKTYKPDAVYSERADWRLQVHPEEFACYQGQFDITVTISRLYE